MSLLDALLLDPPRIDVWIAKRSDSSKGSGTQQDPWNGSTKTDFDKRMREDVQANTCVHLGPGTFETEGYYEGIGTSTGWQMKAGVRLVGSGIDVTVLKRVNNVAVGTLAYAIGHDLSVSSPSAAPVLADFAEVSDLTIDCAFADLTNSSVGAGAIRLMGNHARAHRVKIKNWGNKHTTLPCFGIALLTANTNSGNAASNVAGVINCGIDSCIAMTPASGSTTTVVALHVGAKEDPGTAMGFGVAPYLRNSFVDCADPAQGSRVGLGMSWCSEGLVEGNTVMNADHGGPASGAPNTKLQSAQGLVVRGNTYRNVKRPIHRYYDFDDEIEMSLVIEQNQLELTADSPSGIYIEYQNLLFGSVDMSISRNQLRKTDGSTISDAAHVIQGSRLAVRENTVAGAASTSPLLFDGVTGGAKFFENRTPEGRLLQGRDVTTGALMTELATDAEDALLLSFLRRG